MSQTNDQNPGESDSPTRKMTLSDKNTNIIPQKPECEDSNAELARSEEPRPIAKESKSGFIENDHQSGFIENDHQSGFIENDHQSSTKNLDFIGNVRSESARPEKSRPEESRLKFKGYEKSDDKHHQFESQDSSLHSQTHDKI